MEDGAAGGNGVDSGACRDEAGCKSSVTGTAILRRWWRWRLCNDANKGSGGVGGGGAGGWSVAMSVAGTDGTSSEVAAKETTTWRRYWR